MRLSVVKQSFFGSPGQYGRLVTRANWLFSLSARETSSGNLNLIINLLELTSREMEAPSNGLL